MLAFHTLMLPGDEFVASRRLCSGSTNQFNNSFKNFGWHVKWADPDKPESFVDALSDKTKAIFVESLSNLGGGVTDLEAIARVAQRARVPMIVDNTFATPFLIRPFEHGADIVLHSATKFLGGRCNSMGGIVVDGGSFDWTGDPRYPAITGPCHSHGGMVIGDTFGNFAFAVACRVLGLRDLGLALSPLDAFLILHGIETLPLRMQRHCENALAVAEHLARHPAVNWVHYAGLANDTGHALARRYCSKGAGAVFTFGIAAGYDAGVRFVGKLKLFSHLANVGGTRSLAIHPASMTHHQLEEGERIAMGAGPEIIRVSIGLEDLDDIIADLDQAVAG